MRGCCLLLSRQKNYGDNHPRKGNFKELKKLEVVFIIVINTHYGLHEQEKKILGLSYPCNLFSNPS